MKWLKVFGMFVLLHISSWYGAHWYKTNHPDVVLIVVDTSFALKPRFVDMQRWIDDFESTARYTRFIVGTDKALIGSLEDLKSRESLFRVSFGRSTSESLKRFSQVEADERIFLSDASYEVPGWTIVRF